MRAILVARSPVVQTIDGFEGVNFVFCVEAITETRLFCLIFFPTLRHLKDHSFSQSTGQKRGTEPCVQQYSRLTNTHSPTNRFRPDQNSNYMDRDTRVTQLVPTAVSHCFCHTCVHVFRTQSRHAQDQSVLHGQRFRSSDPLASCVISSNGPAMSWRGQ